MQGIFPPTSPRPPAAAQAAAQSPHAQLASRAGSAPPRPSHYHLILDDAQRLVEALVAYPGRKAERHADGTPFPLVNLGGFLTAVRGLPDSASYRHPDDNLLYRLSRYRVREGHALLAVPTYRPPTGWHELNGSGPMEMMERSIAERSGLVLFLGDMASGKTTAATTYLTQCLLKRTGTAFAWQDPIETDLEGWHGAGYCHQIEIETAGYTQAAVEAKRSRAQYLFFGEARTPESCLAILDAAMAGPQTITTSHGDNLINGIRSFATKAQIIDAHAYHLLAASLIAAIHLSLRSGSRGPEWSIETLLVQPSQSDPIRVALREGNVERLVTEIRMQARSNEKSQR